MGQRKSALVQKLFKLPEKNHILSATFRLKNGYDKRLLFCHPEPGVGSL
jgi:hypothetical protein